MLLWWRNIYSTERSGGRQEAGLYAWEGGQRGPRSICPCSALQKIVSDMGDCLGFLKSSRGDSRPFLGYPLFYLAVSTAREFVLISRLKCTCSAALGNKSPARTTPPPYSLYFWEGRLEHMTVASLKLYALGPLHFTVHRPQRGNMYWDFQISLLLGILWTRGKRT